MRGVRRHGSASSTNRIRKVHQTRLVHLFTSSTHPGRAVTAARVQGCLIPKGFVHAQEELAQSSRQLALCFNIAISFELISLFKSGSTVSVR